MNKPRYTKLRKYPLQQCGRDPVVRQHALTDDPRSPSAEDFVAHASNVNCLKIGRKSSGVLVTGGEDKKVNVYAIGKQTAALVSCTGTRAPEAAVMLTRLVAPVTPGLTRHLAAFTQSLQGHSSSVESVTFDKEEEVVVAGGANGTIKLWDLEQAKGAACSACGRLALPPPAPARALVH